MPLSLTQWIRAALVAIFLGLPLAAAAQLVITNGVQTHDSLASTVVTLSNRCELRLTNTSAPLTGCTINLNSTNAWLFLTGVKPSVVASTYLGQVKVSGAAAVSGSNVRVVEYGMGAVVIPHAPGFQPLQVFTGTNFTGTSGNLGQYTAYTDANLGAFANTISSFHLKRGYMATFAQNTDGTGNSRNFIAADGDLDVSFMPAGLDKSVSFIRVFPWRWTAKKGFCQTGTTPTAGLNLNPAWNYSWDINQNSTLDREYVGIRQTRWWPSLSQDWQARSINTLLGYNEPDSTSQANLAVGDAIWSWPDLLGTGLRVGSPAVTDGGRSSWLYPFMEQVDAANLRVDFVAIHYYQQNNPADPAAVANQMYNFLKATYDQVKRPLWITEWNNGANWTTGWPDPTYAQQQACIAAMVDMLESTPFVERYAIYNWVEDVRRVAWDDGSLTDAGVTYRDKASRIGYLQDGLPGSVRSIARFRFEGDVLDSSGAGNNGIAVGIPSYAAGTNGQALQLDGTNSYVILPASTANSSAFTFAAWVNWDGGVNWQRIFDFGNDTTHYLFLTPNTGSGLRFAINNGSGEQTLTSATALPIGQWQHVAVTISNTTARLYTNGVLAASSTSFSILPSQFNPQRNYLGKSQFSADPLFRGRLDDVVLAYYAMSPAEIAALSANQAPVFLNLGNGVWGADASGNWGDASRWSSYQPANGAGGTADFTALDITANRTATLDSSRSIGTLKFGDVSGAQTWALSASGGSSLTLDSGSATQPSIVVNENTATISAPLAGTNGFQKSGVGTLTLSGANPLSGALNVDTDSGSLDGGVVRLGSASACTNLTAIAIRNNNSGSSTLELAGGALAAAPITLRGRNTNVAGIKNVSGSNTLSGNLSIGSGGSYYLLQSDAGTLNLGGIISSAVTGPRSITFQGAGDHYLSGSIQNGSATVSVTKLDAGNLILANTNTYTGSMTAGGGAVRLAHPLALQNIALNLPSAGTNFVRFSGITGASIGSLSGLGDIWLTNASLAAVTLTNGANNSSSVYAGALRGSGSLVKAGSGTLTLGGTNAYTGATTIAGGTVKFGTATNLIGTLQPVLWLSFDSVTGSVVTNQGSGGLAMSGALLGTGAYITNAGRFGSALYLNGTGSNSANNIVKISSKGADTSASGSWTVGYWIKTTTAGAVILYQGDGTWSSSGQTVYYLNAGSAAAGGTRAGAVRWGGNWLSGTAALNDGNWHFIALVDTAGTETIYVDGNPDTVTGTMSGALAAGANQIWIGGSPDGGDGTVKMTGMIDEVVMFSRALSANEIRAIYTNAPVAGKLPAASTVNVASGAVLDLTGISQSVAALSDYNNTGGLITNSAAALPVTLALGLNSAVAPNFRGVIADASAANAISVVKSGTSTQVLSGANTYRGPTTVSNGVLIVNGSLRTNTVSVRGGMLAGTGSISGPVAVFGGGTLSPGSNAVGTLTIQNSSLALAGTTYMELDAAQATNDLVTGVASISYGGTLQVANLNGALAGGSAFKLFSASSASGNFATLTGSPGPDLTWKFNPTNGVLAVFSTAPASLGMQVAAGSLQLSWPPDHLGWMLQVQTNDLSSGLGTNWLTIPESATNTQFSVPINPADPSVFYRLIFQ